MNTKEQTEANDAKNMRWTKVNTNRYLTRVSKWSQRGWNNGPQSTITKHTPVIISLKILNGATDWIQLSRYNYHLLWSEHVIGDLRETIQVTFETCTERWSVMSRCSQQVSGHTNALPVGEVTGEVWWTWDVYSLPHSIGKRGTPWERRRRAAAEPPDTAAERGGLCGACGRASQRTAGMCAVQKQTHMLGYLYVVLDRFQVLGQCSRDYGVTLLCRCRKPIIGNEPVTRWK